MRKIVFSGVKSENTEGYISADTREKEILVDIKRKGKGQKRQKY